MMFDGSKKSCFQDIAARSFQKKVLTLGLRPVILHMYRAAPVGLE
jgi:hypothetical protein